MTTCTACDGWGYAVDHDDRCYQAGECVGCGGVQVPCERCRAMGEIGGDEVCPRCGYWSGGMTCASNCGAGSGRSDTDG